MRSARERKPFVPRQIVRRHGYSMAIEVGWRGTQNCLQIAQSSCNPTGVGELANANGDIDTCIDQVDHRVLHQQTQTQLRRLRQQLRQRWCDVAGEADGR